MFPVFPMGEGFQSKFIDPNTNFLPCKVANIKQIKIWSDPSIGDPPLSRDRELGTWKN